MAKSENEETAAPEKKRGETLRAIIIAALLALGIRSFVIEPFKIPSESMLPTLLVGDYVLVNKFAYGVRLPFTGTLLFGQSAPERGDVIVFKLPDDQSQDYIKRVIGLGGDKIEIVKFRLYVNDQLVDRITAEPFLLGDRTVPHYTENNPEGVEYSILHDAARGFAFRENEGPFQVPDGHYFMMGDNRDNSQDSRRWRQKFVAPELIKGRAFMIHWSWVLSGDASSQRGFLADLANTVWKVVSFQVEEVRWHRLGRSVDIPAD